MGRKPSRSDDDRDWPCGCQSRRSGDDVLTLLCPVHAAEVES